MKTLGVGDAIEKSDFVYYYIVMSDALQSSLRLLCWNINGAPNTIENAALRFGSWLGFFQQFKLDILCLQVHIELPT
jgi:hypothetical protein